MKAHEFLEAGIGHMKDRAATYAAPSGERSMEKTVAIFNELLAEKLRKPLSEEDGWNFMEILKLVRSKQGEFKADSYEDRAAYAGLAGEAAAKKGNVSPSEYRSFLDRIADVEVFLDGITIAAREKGGGVFVTNFARNLATADFIATHHNNFPLMIVWVDDVVAYDSFLAKDGELDKLLEQLKK